MAPTRCSMYAASPQVAACSTASPRSMPGAPLLLVSGGASSLVEVLREVST
ncbi:MAG: hypothetical protein R3E65_04775 [Steroidobacteraceae bacterium]